jgi:hypothetical protein
LTIGVEEGSFNITGVCVRASGGHEGDNNAKGAEFHNGGKGVRVVDAGTLTKTLCHDPSFEAIDRAIGVRLDFENPLSANGVTAEREVCHAEGAFVMKGSENRADGGFPFRGIFAEHSVLEFHKNRNVRGMGVGELGSGITRLRIEIEIEIVYNNTSKNRLSSLAPPFCYAIQDLEA